MTADEHTGVHRYTFNHSKDARLSLDVTSAAGDNGCTDGFASFDEKTGVLTGGAVLRAVFSERYDGLPVYFAAKANKEIKSCTITGDETNLIADLNFGSLENESVELKVAVSFVSEESSNISSAVSQVSAKSNSQEAIAALTALGYTQTEASVAISKLDQSLSVEDLIKGALKNMTLRF